MKQLLILLFVLLNTVQLFSQEKRLQELSIEQDNSPSAIKMYHICGTENGVIVFNTTISDLEFNIPDAPKRLKKVSYDNTGNYYVLCVQPTDEIGAYNGYIIEIKGKNYKLERFSVSMIKPVQAQYFKINPKTKNNTKFCLGLSNGIVAGKTIGVYSSFRFGGKVGTGLEGGVGISGKFMHWSLGAKLFPFNTNSSELIKGLCLSVHYGTVSVEKSNLSNVEDGHFEFYGDKHLNGFSSLIGYDNVLNKKIHINAGVGISYNEQGNIIPAWNIGIGFSILDILKKR